MGGPRSDEDQLLAIALGSRENDRRVLPDRRTGIDRRQYAEVAPDTERRSGTDRRQRLRRAGEAPGGLLARASDAARTSDRRH